MEIRESCRLSQAPGYFSTPCNRPLTSSKNLHFQNEAKSTAFLVKMRFICIRMKIISTSKAEHLTSFLYRDPEELGNGVLNWHQNLTKSRNE